MLCPNCLQDMVNVDIDEDQRYPDTALFYCETCQLEQIVRWDTGERYLYQKDDDGITFQP
ncbi:MAG: hypothetical protein GX208_00590 [Firmicutes bacterium]|nr:hypothetical protein [Bacillota bacterium]